MYRKANTSTVAILNGCIVKFQYHLGFDHIRFSCRAEAIDYLFDNGWQLD